MIELQRLVLHYQLDTGGSFLVHVADWAAKGDMDAMDSFERLSEAFK